MPPPSGKLPKPSPKAKPKAKPPSSSPVSDSSVVPPAGQPATAKKTVPGITSSTAPNKSGHRTNPETWDEKRKPAQALLVPKSLAKKLKSGTSSTAEDLEQLLQLENFSPLKEYVGALDSAAKMDLLDLAINRVGKWPASPERNSIFVDTNEEQEERRKRLEEEKRQFFSQKGGESVVNKISKAASSSSAGAGAGAPVGGDANVVSGKNAAVGSSNGAALVAPPTLNTDRDYKQRQYLNLGLVPGRGSAPPCLSVHLDRKNVRQLVLVLNAIRATCANKEFLEEVKASSITLNRLGKDSSAITDVHCDAGNSQELANILVWGKGYCGGETWVVYQGPYDEGGKWFDQVEWIGLPSSAGSVERIRKSLRDRPVGKAIRFRVRKSEEEAPRLDQVRIDAGDLDGGGVIELPYIRLNKTCDVRSFAALLLCGPGKHVVQCGSAELVG